MPILERAKRRDDEGEDGDDPLESLFNRARAAVGLRPHERLPEHPEAAVEPGEAIVPNT